MDKHYKGLIWTNHAISRMYERGISQGDAWATWNRPEQSRKGQSGNWIYYRTYGNQRIEVVAKNLPAQAGNQEGKWIILSVWSKYINKKPSKSFPWLTNILNLFKFK